jgi:DNA polymerase-4
MQSLGIETGLDLRAQSLPFLRQHFGKSGSYYYWISRGVDNRPVQADRVRKSIGVETTFAQDIHDQEAAGKELKPLIEKLWRHCESTGMRGKTLTLKVKYADFQQVTRSRTSKTAVSTKEELERISYELLDSIFPVSKGVRLLGISMSSFGDEEISDKHQLLLSF